MRPSANFGKVAPCSLFDFRLFDYLKKINLVRHVFRWTLYAFLFLSGQVFAAQNVQTVAMQASASSSLASQQASATTNSTDSRLSLPGIALRGSSGSAAQTSQDTALAMRIVLGLTVLAILPALLISLTSFLRIIIVLSMLRHAIGLQDSPPNMVLTSLALFFTLFTMSPVIEKINEQAFQPFMQGQITSEVAYQSGIKPIREFMLKQTREQDVALMIELSKMKQPQSIDDVGNLQLIPAFMLSELRAAFQIGFVVFLPFLLIDLVVSSILMGLGMMMMPPVTISLPLKILLFVLVDGWGLLIRALVGSFH